MVADATAELSCKSSFGIRIGFVIGLLFLGSLARMGACAAGSTAATMGEDGTCFALVFLRLGGFDVGGGVDADEGASESTRLFALGAGAGFTAFALAAAVAAAAAALAAPPRG